MCITGSSTVQLHENLSSRRLFACSETGFSSQNGDRAWGVGRGSNDSMQRIFIKRCSLFTVRSVRRVKRFTTGWQTFRWWWRGWNGGAEVAETTVKRLLCCWFWRTGKAMGQVYQCRWRICREINIFFSGLNVTCFKFYIHLWYIYWLPSCVIIPPSIGNN
jgi:hypothetical protein